MGGALRPFVSRMRIDGERRTNFSNSNTPLPGQVFMGTSRRGSPKYGFVEPNIGERFGKLTFRGIGRHSSGVKFCDCACDCGGETRTTLQKLRQGTVVRCRSCGASAGSEKANSKYHAICPDLVLRKRLLGIIQSIRDRCTNPKNKMYRYYGGRGISIWPEWTANRSLFLAYLISLPGHEMPGLELDRIDNDLGYKPGNLRFVSRKQNQNNKRLVSDLQGRLDVALEEIEMLRACLRHCKCRPASEVHNSKR